MLYWNGHRVMGVLAMSRAIGDHGLRPYVISDPEISVINRCVEAAGRALWERPLTPDRPPLQVRR